MVAFDDVKTVVTLTRPGKRHLKRYVLVPRVTLNSAVMVRPEGERNLEPPTSLRYGVGGFVAIQTS